MNIGLNVDDYNSFTDFIKVIKQAIRKKIRKIAIKSANGLDSTLAYNASIDDFLYWKMLSIEEEESEDGLATYDIDINEVGGNKSYYLLYGDRRKPENTVRLKVFPDDLDVNSVSSSDVTVEKVLTNEYSFTMPSSDVLLTITYGDEQTSYTVYWGVSEDTTLTITDITDTNSKEIWDIDTVQFSIPYNNSDNYGYIWVASPVELVNQGIRINEALLLQQEIDNTTSMEEFDVDGIPYYVYLHSWNTAVDSVIYSTNTIT